MPNSCIVRVGIRVSREDSKYTPFTYHMFYCRQKDKYPDSYLASWAKEEIELLSIANGIPGQDKLAIDDSRRYWVRMRMTSYQDYQGEYYSCLEILNCKPCR
jgi:hypothetical protein